MRWPPRKIIKRKEETKNVFEMKEKCANQENALEKMCDKRSGRKTKCPQFLFVVNRH